MNTNTKIEFRELTPQDGNNEMIYAMTQDIGRDENRFNNEPYGMTLSEFSEWVMKQYDWSLGKNLPEGYVKQWTYWLFVNDIPVGYGRLREKVTEQSRKFGGNIGFAIRKSRRGGGGCTLLFGLLLWTAKSKHLETIFSTVEKYNFASKRVHEKCGGIITGENESRWFFRFEV